MTRLLALVVGIAAIVRFGVIGLPACLYPSSAAPLVNPPAAHMVGQPYDLPGHPHAQIAPSGPADGIGQDPPEDDGDMDIEGDEVTAAVAKYSIDSEGNLYEVHAPHTEVPRLGRPQG